MAPRAVARVLTLALALVVLAAAPAGAATDIHLLASATPTDVSGIGPSNSGASLVFTQNCNVMRLIPGSGAPSVIAGQGCNVGQHGVTAAAVAATSVSLGGGRVAGTEGDDGVLVGDGSNGIVDRVVSNTIQTFAGTGTCGAPPADDSLAKDADLCQNQGVAADPADSGRFAIADFGDFQSALGTNRVYLVAGSTRDNSKITTVAGGCQPSPAVAALMLCFNGIDDIAFAGSNTILIVQNGIIDAVSLLDGSVVSLLPDFEPGLGSVIGGYRGDAYFTDGCLVKRIDALDGTGTITTVAGSTCDGARVNDVPATQTTVQPSSLGATTTGLLVGEQGDIRLIDRTSITSHPPRYTNNRDNSISFATLSGGHTQCGFSGTLMGAIGFPDCDNPYVVPGQLDDDYTFSVAENEGTMDPTGAQWSWTVDTLAPSTPAPSAPAADAHVDSATPSFEWGASSDPMIGGATQIDGSGIDHYELFIDGTMDGDFACCKGPPVHPLGEGTHKWKVRALDRAGNASGFSDERTLDYGSAPTAGLTVAPNPALTNATITLDGSTSHDAEGPIADYKWDTDGDGSFDRDSGTTASTTLSFAEPGTHTLGLQVTDSVGKTATATAELKVNANVAGSLLGVTIDNGAQYTRDPNVVIGIKAPASVNSVVLSNDGGFLAPATFPLAKEIKWKLDSSGPERLPKIVYARFRTGSIVLDNTFTDDIILDETPPVVQTASLAPVGNSAARAARKRAYVIKVRATDSNSGVSHVQVTAVKRRPGKLVRYERTERLKLAAKPKFIRARDRAGNFSRWKKLR